MKAPWYSTLDFYVRKRRDYNKPTRGELENRIRFASASTKQYGRRGMAPDGNPIVAAQVQREMKSLPPIRKSVEEIDTVVIGALQDAMLRRGIQFVKIPEKYVLKEKEALPDQRAVPALA